MGKGEGRDELGDWNGHIYTTIYKIKDVPGGSVVKKLPANVGDTGSVPGTGRSHMPQSD